MLEALLTKGRLFGIGALIVLVVALGKGLAG